MPSGTDAHRFKVSSPQMYVMKMHYYTVYKRTVSDITVGTKLHFDQMASDNRFRLISELL